MFYNGYSDSYDNLKTFQEVLQEQTQAVVFGDTQIDEATQTSIVNWFQFRKVSDNDKFVAYFQRLLKANEEQYINYMRIHSEGIAKGLTASAFVKRHRLKSASSVQSATKQLLEMDLITKEGNEYTLSDPLLKLWLTREIQ